MRSCGACSMCCKLLVIPELEKPANKWCDHCSPGAAAPCRIYADRPGVCADFKCMWLTGQLPEDWYPLRSKMVLFTAVDQGARVVKVNVDARSPSRWREPRYWDRLRAQSIAGLRERPRRLVVVFAGARKYLVLGDNVVEDPPDGGHLVQTAQERWELVA